MPLRLRTPRSIVWLTLWAFLATVGLPIYESHGLGEADDAACLEALGQTEDAPRLAAPDADAPGHCAVCHLLRAVGGSIAPPIAALAAPASRSTNARPIARLTLATGYSPVLSRGPPISS